jgi:hypothetical protein
VLAVQEDLDMSYRQTIPACTSLGAGSVDLQRRGRQLACALSANKRAVAASCATVGTRPPANVRWLRPPRASSTLTRRGGEAVRVGAGSWITKV